MSLDIDTSRSIRTPAGRRELIRAVRDSIPGELELDWIEWKSEVDLREKRWKHEVARQVLGFANRDPARAAVTAEGCAYLLMGVEPGNLCGVDAIDSAELEDGVGRYLGPQGPHWNPDLEEVDGATVLVVTVEAPRAGDPIFTLEKQFEGFLNGEVYVRRAGKTERANAADIRLLTARARAGGPPKGLSIDVVPLEETDLRIRPTELGDEVAQWWVEREREGWTSAYRRQYATMGGTRTSRLIVNPAFRSPERFKEDVDEYLANGLHDFRLRACLLIYGLGIGRIELAIDNLTEDNYAQVEVVLQLPSTVSAFFDEDDLIGDYELPARPALSLDRFAYLSPSSFAHISALHGPSGHVRGGSTGVDVHFAPVNVRPAQRHPLEAVTVAADAGLAGQEIQCRWYATSSSRSGLAEGEITIEIAADVLPAAELFGPFDPGDD